MYSNWFMEEMVTNQQTSTNQCFQVTDSDSMCHGTVLSAEKPSLESLDSSTAICQGPEFSFRHLLELELHHFSPETSVTQ